MKAEERDKLIQEVHQGLFGVKGTEDDGIVGEIKGINKHLLTQNTNILKNAVTSTENKKSISLQWKIFGGVFLLIVGQIVLNAFGII